MAGKGWQQQDQEAERSHFYPQTGNTHVNWTKPAPMMYFLLKAIKPHQTIPQIEDQTFQCPRPQGTFPVQTTRRKGFVWRTLPSHNLLLREVGAETWRQEPWRNAAGNSTAHVRRALQHPLTVKTVPHRHAPRPVWSTHLTEGPFSANSGLCPVGRWN